MEDQSRVRKFGLQQIVVSTLFAINFVYSIFANTRQDLEIIYFMLWPVLLFALVFFINGLTLTSRPAAAHSFFAPSQDNSSKIKTAYVLTWIVIGIIAVVSINLGKNVGDTGGLAYYYFFVVGSMCVYFLGFLYSFFSQKQKLKRGFGTFIIFTLLTVAVSFISIMSIPEAIDSSRADTNAAEVIERVTNLKIGSSLAELQSLFTESPEIIPEGYNRYGTGTGGNNWLSLQPYSLEILDKGIRRLADRVNRFEGNPGIRLRVSVLNGFSALANCGDEVLVLSSGANSSDQDIQLMYANNELVYKKVGSDLITTENLLVRDGESILVCGVPYSTDYLRGIVSNHDDERVHLRHIDQITYGLPNDDDKLRIWLENNEDLEQQWRDLVREVNFE